MKTGYNNNGIYLYVLYILIVKKESYTGKHKTPCDSSSVVTRMTTLTVSVREQKERKSGVCYENRIGY